MSKLSWQEDEIQLPRELLIIPKLSAETSGAIHLDIDFLPARIYKDIRARCHQIGKIDKRGGNIINDGLARGINRLVVRLPFI